MPVNFTPDASAPAPSKIAFTPDDDTSGMVPTPGGLGSAPRVVDEMHPAITTGERFIAQGLGSSPESKAAYIEQEHPELQTKIYNGDVLVKGTGEDTWRKLAPSWKNVGDYGYSAMDSIPQLAEGLASGAGLAAAGPPGAAAAGAGSEALRQYLGQRLGIPDNMSGGQIAMSGAVNGVLPILGAGAGEVYNAAKPYVKGGVASLSSMLSGVPTEAVGQLLNRPGQVMGALAKEGKDKLSNILSVADDAASEARARYKQESALQQNALNAFRQNEAETPTPVDTSDLHEMLDQAINKFAPNSSGKSALSKKELGSLKDLSENDLSSHIPVHQPQSIPANSALGDSSGTIQMGEVGSKSIPVKDAGDLQKTSEWIQGQLDQAQNAKVIPTAKPSRYESILGDLRSRLQDKIYGVDPNLGAANARFGQYADQAEAIAPLADPLKRQSFVNNLYGPNKEATRNSVQQLLPNTWNDLADIGAAKAFTKTGPSGSEIGLRNIGGVGMGALGLAGGGLYHSPGLAAAGLAGAAAINPTVHRTVLGNASKLATVLENANNFVPDYAKYPALSQMIESLGMNKGKNR